jgi:hypothetical protein
MRLPRPGCSLPQAERMDAALPCAAMRYADVPRRCRPHPTPPLAEPTRDSWLGTESGCSPGAHTRDSGSPGDEQARVEGPGRRATGAGIVVPRPAGGGAGAGPAKGAMGAVHPIAHPDATRPSWASGAGHPRGLEDASVPDVNRLTVRADRDAVSEARCSRGERGPRGRRLSPEVIGGEPRLPSPGEESKARASRSRPARGPVPRPVT